jgi:two-component system CheB/CheR fusion protein
MALHKAARGKEVVVSPGVRVKTNGSFATINLTVSPVLADPSAMPEAPLYLVILEEAPKEPKGSAGSGLGKEDRGRKADAGVVALKKKLQEKEEYLRSSLEELESSTEELKSANEEMQSVNEELQSSNEELETAKEELQSSNEELHTVNNELQNKVLDLAQANNDINNLLVGTGIGTLFVDHQMRILRFTSPVAEIINVAPDDTGRPVHDFTTRFKKYSALEEDVRAVLRSLVPTEREVQTTQGKWYLLRILPYRTTENVIEGATISFVDITGHKRDELVSARLAAIVESSEDAIIAKDLDGIITAWNRGAERIFGYTAAEMVGTSILRLIPSDRHQEEHDILEKIKNGESIEHFETVRQAKGGRLLDVSVTASSIRDDNGTVVGVSKVARDITEKKQSQQTQARMAVVVRDAHDAVTVQDLEGRTLAWNPGAERMYGWSEAEALSMNVRDRIAQELREGALDKLAQLSRAEILEPYRTQRLTKDGRVKEVSIISTALLNEAGKMYAIATTERVIAGGAP